MSRARQAAHGMLQNRVSKRGGKEDRGHSPVHSAFAKTGRRRTEGARLQRQSEGGPRAQPRPQFVCKDSQRERERNRAQPGPHRAMAGRERNGAGGSAWFSNHAQTLPRKRARETERDRERERERESVWVCLSERASERAREEGRRAQPAQPTQRDRTTSFRKQEERETERDRERQRERACERARAQREEVGGPRGLPSPQPRPAAAARPLRHSSNSPADCTVCLLPRAPPAAPPEQLLTAREPWRPPPAASSGGGATGTSSMPPRA